MKLVHCGVRNPWRNVFGEAGSWQDDFNKLFGAEAVFSPAIDVQDRKSDFLVRADLPGVSKDQIEVSVQDGALVIRGEKKQEGDVKEENHIVRERFYASFERIIALPGEVDAKRISASYKNGVLEVVLPKVEGAQPTKIAVN